MSYIIFKFIQGYSSSNVCKKSQCILNDAHSRLVKKLKDKEVYQLCDCGGPRAEE